MPMHPDQDVDPPPAARSRGLVAFLVIAGMILLFVAMIGRRQLPVGMHHPGVGDHLETLRVEPLLNAEQPVTGSDINGQVTLINCWGPWCGPCLMEMPELLKLERKYRGRPDVRFLLVSFPNSHYADEEELRTDSSDALERFKSDPPIYHDPQRQLIPELIRAAQLSEFVFPTTMVLDRRGTIRAIWTGFDRSFVTDMDQTILRLLAEKETPKAS